MKKILSILALAGLALTGCVDDNPSVILNGFMEPGTCSISGSDQEMISGRACDPSTTMNTSPYLMIDLHLNNYITGEPPWSSSGGGSGTTFEPDIPNQGMIFLERVITKCYSIDGDVTACQDKDPIIYEFSSPLHGNGSGFCLWEYPIDYTNIMSWGGTNIVLDTYLEYHDASLIKGQTSHGKFNLIFISSPDPKNACSYVKPSEDSGEETPNE